jgi:SAM-dependent methyltransferase
MTTTADTNAEAASADKGRPPLRACPQCGSNRASGLPQYSPPEWRVVQCDACGFVFLHNAPEYDRLVSEFAWERTFVAETKKRKAESLLLSWISANTRWRLSLLSPSLPHLLRENFLPGRVLDIGCGTGGTIPEPFLPFGIEISEVQARIAHTRMAERGGAVIQGPATESIARFPDKHFTGVIIRSFIEHEKEPKPLLREVRRVLNDDGAVYMRAPNYGGINRRMMGAKWCGFRHPDHVNYFTLASLKKMAADCGFSFKLLSGWRLMADDSIKGFLRKA